MEVQQRPRRLKKKPEPKPQPKPKPKQKPKKNLIAKESNRLSIITEQDIEESYITEQDAGKVPITNQNAYRLADKVEIPPLSFKKIHREVSFSSKKLLRHVKSPRISKISTEPLSTSINSGGQTNNGEVYCTESKLDSEEVSQSELDELKIEVVLEILAEV